MAQIGDDAESMPRKQLARVGVGNQLNLAATTFAPAFYRAIGFGRTIQEAFDQAKTALLLHGIREEHVPRLLARGGVSADAVRLVGSL